MNYLKIYCKLIRKEESKKLTKKEAKNQGLYVEGHHVFPQCLYGQTRDGNDRIVYVSPRVHYILHALLEKAFIKRYGIEHPKTIKMTFAHALMKGYEYNERYVNSYLYENLKIRVTNALRGKKRPKYIHEKVSKTRKGKYGGRNNPSAVPIKIYYEDGTTLEYYDGVINFCKTYKYCWKHIHSLRKGQIEKYKDIIKIETLEKKKKVTPKKKMYNKVRSGRTHSLTIPIRIYYADGRIEECIDGTGIFCKNNPQYKRSGLNSVRQGERPIYKDIVKVEDMNRYEKSNPIIKKYYNKNYVPIKIYFLDGRVVISEKGAADFCKKNPEYERRLVTRVSLGKLNRHKDIIKVERLVEW